MGDGARELASLIVDLASSMITSGSRQEMGDLIASRIVESLPLAGAAVTLYPDDQAETYIASSFNTGRALSNLQLELNEGPCRTTITSGRLEVVTDTETDDRYPRFSAAARGAGVQSVYAFPLLFKDRCFGSVDLYQDTRVPLDPRSLDMVRAVADLAACLIVAIEDKEGAVQQIDWFRDRSLHDPLTGLANRALLYDRFEHAAQRGRRSRDGITAVLFVDLDGFKQVNDTYGHAVGDGVLVAVADRLSKAVRPGDTLARFAGDEFVAVCEDLPSEEAMTHLVARIEAAFREPMDVQGHSLPMSASIGVTYVGPGDAVGESMLLDADRAMYRAKAAEGTSHRVVDLRGLMSAPD